MHRNIPLNRRVPHGALVMLERSAAKVARCVLRGLGEGDLAWLPGALRVIADRIEHGEHPVEPIQITFAACASGERA
jgi:hypothetical protein